MIDAMKLFRDFASDRRSILVKGDSGVLPLLKSLRQAKVGLYKSSKINQDECENAYGVFTRFQWRDSTYAAIVEARSEEDAVDVYLAAQRSLHAGEAKILSLVRLPTSRIVPFPFFVVCDQAMREVGGKMATNYWLKLKDDNESIATWLKDFLRYRREIVQTWAPDIEPAVPFLLSAQRVYAIHDSAGWLALRYYKDQGTVDRVEVRQASRESPSYGRKGNTIDFKQFFVDLPPETDLIQERSSWSSKSGRAHRNWPHPFLEAASEVRKLINDYNSSVPRIFLDALDLTDSRLSHFTSSEIQMMRELSKRFPEISELFTQYQTKVQVVHIVHLHEYRDNWIRDGALSSYFFHADTDEVHVIRIDEATHVIKFDEILARLGLSEQDAFRQQRSSILYYLREIAGLN